MQSLNFCITSSLTTPLPARSCALGSVFFSENTVQPKEVYPIAYKGLHSRLNFFTYSKTSDCLQNNKGCTLMWEGVCRGEKKTSFALSSCSTPLNPTINASNSLSVIA